MTRRREAKGGHKKSKKRGAECFGSRALGLAPTRTRASHNMRLKSMHDNLCAQCAFYFEGKSPRQPEVQRAAGAMV